jgi:PAS domain S-box-containing protein
MIRHVTAYHAQTGDVKSHLTSLSHLSPDTAPDEWERSALAAFENGRREVLEITGIDGQSHLRLMRPIKAEPHCLSCHTGSPDAPGENLGGVSVSISMEPYWDSWRKQLFKSIPLFAVMWLIGTAGLSLFFNRFSSQLEERKRAETTLQASQENYRVLVDNSLTGIYVVQHGRIVFANAEFARIHGFTLNEMIGVESLSLVHPNDRQELVDCSRKRYRGEPVADQFQLRCLTRQGQVIWVQRRSALTTYNGQPAILGNEIDITSHMLADAELESSERQLQRLADGLIELREIERNQFATEIHENIAQSLSAIKIRVESVLRDIDDNSIFCEPLRPVITHVQNTIADIRIMAQRYRPVGLDNIGIILTLDWLCRQTARENPSLRISKSIQVSEDNIPDALKIIIFRIVEQILHSLSSQNGAMVHIGLEPIAKRLFLSVATNVGIAELNRAPSRSPLGMELAVIALKRHVESYGGTFMVTAEHSQQTRVIASWDYFCGYPADTAM